MAGICRCGHVDDGATPHPCHFGGYRCRAPASHRFYDARPVALAGVQMKVQVSDTWACDEHWRQFSTPTPEARDGG